MSFWKEMITILSYFKNCMKSSKVNMQNELNVLLRNVFFLWLIKYEAFLSHVISDEMSLIITAVSPVN